MENFKNIVIAILVIVIAGMFFYGGDLLGANSYGPQHLQRESFLQGAAFGTRDQMTISNAGVVSMPSLTLSGALSGASATLSSTLSVTATSTLSDTVNFNNPGICINFYATSTATRLHMIASSTASVTGQVTENGVMLFGYGACSL